MLPQPPPSLFILTARGLWPPPPLCYPSAPSQFAGVLAEQRHALRRTAGGTRGAALSTTVRLSLERQDKPIAEQLRDVLTANFVRVLDLFRAVSRRCPCRAAFPLTAELVCRKQPCLADVITYIVLTRGLACTRHRVRAQWDENGDGQISKVEFVRGMAPLGIVVPPGDAAALFDTFDEVRTPSAGHASCGRCDAAGPCVYPVCTLCVPCVYPVCTLCVPCVLPMMRAAHALPAVHLPTVSNSLLAVWR